MMSSKNRKTNSRLRKSGALPLYMRTQLSQSTLSRNPQYKDLFHKCPNCDHYSLKPVGMEHIKDVSKTKEANERKCTICNYIHVCNLVVDSVAASASAPINVTESIDAIKKGRILQQQGE